MNRFHEIMLLRKSPKLKGVILFIALLYFTIYLPLAFIFYFPNWHWTYSRFNQGCDKVGYQIVWEGVHELNSFLRNRGKLSMPYWTEKEKLHLTEVRGMMNKMTGIALISVIVLILTFDSLRVRRLAGINTVIIISLLLIIPFFAYFWRHIFHPLLFANKAWMNTPKDFSYWILPREFFKYSMALIISVSCLLNLSFWILLRKRPSRRK